MVRTIWYQERKFVLLVPRGKIQRGRFRFRVYSIGISFLCAFSCSISNSAQAEPKRSGRDSCSAVLSQTAASGALQTVKSNIGFVNQRCDQLRPLFWESPNGPISTLCGPATLANLYSVFLGVEGFRLQEGESLVKVVEDLAGFRRSRHPFANLSYFAPSNGVGSHLMPDFVEEFFASRGFTVESGSYFYLEDFGSLRLNVNGILRLSVRKRAGLILYIGVENGPVTAELLMGYEQSRHFVLVIGADLERGLILIQDPEKELPFWARLEELRGTLGNRIVRISRVDGKALNWTLREMIVTEWKSTKKKKL